MDSPKKTCKISTVVLDFFSFLECVCVYIVYTKYITLWPKESMQLMFGINKYVDIAADFEGM